jgi:hypothetical protein
MNGFEHAAIWFSAVYSLISQVFRDRWMSHGQPRPEVWSVISLLTYEETYPGVGTVLSRDLAHLIDLGELCLP